MKTCPSCNTSLTAAKFGTVEVEECTKCRGTWFREDEFRLAKEEADGDLAWKDYDPGEHGDKFRASPRHLSCPDCGVELVELDYDTSDVAIDYCRSCSGIWLDADEFKRIIDVLENELDGRDAPHYLRESLKQAREVLSGSKSHLSELRDFRTVMTLLRYRFLAEHTGFTKFLMNFPRI